MLQSSPSAKTTHVCKAPPPHKPTCCYVDDTDTKDNSDSCQAAVGPSDSMDEWKTYLNTIEDVPAEMGIVHWWGVSDSSFCLCAVLIAGLSPAVVEWVLIPDLAINHM